MRSEHGRSGKRIKLWTGPEFFSRHENGPALAEIADELAKLRNSQPISAAVGGA